MKTARAQSILSLLCVQVLVAVLPFSASAATMGTTSGSGGNGVAGKAFESYIRDPQALPAYIRHLKPIFDRLDAISNSNDQTGKPSDILRAKPWYFIPEKLKTLPKGTIGVSFIQGKMQQLALQTDRAIWVDSLLFDSNPNSLEQADLILHEAVMTLYSIKFMNVSEVLKFGERLGTRGNENPPSPNTLAELDAALPATPKRELNSEDYDNIRTMTNWLKLNGSRMSLNDYESQLKANDFDQRFKTPGKEGSQSGPGFQISPQEFEAAWERARVVGRLPSLCKTLSDLQDKPCEITLTEGQRNLIPGAGPSKTQEIRLQQGNGAKLSTHVFTDPKLTGGSISISDWGTQGGNGQKVYLTMAPAPLTQAKIGDRYNFTVIFWKKLGTPEKPKFEIEALMITPMIITGFEKQQGGNVMCELEKSQRKSPEDQSVVAHTPEFGKENYFLRTFNNPNFLSWMSCSP